MSPTPAGAILRHIHRIAVTPICGEPDDCELVHRFVTVRDEAAFETLLARHGRLVWGVCRRVLHHEHEAEDAFQATFLVFTRRATALRKQTSVGSFLYGIAYRIALRIKQGTARQPVRERMEPAACTDGVVAEVACRELQALVDEELDRLPEKLRAPFVLCCLDGRSRIEAAAELGWREGTVSSRIAEARTRLRQRLARRGVTLSTALCLTDLATSSARSAVPSALLESTRQTVLLAAAAGARPSVLAAATGFRPAVPSAALRLVAGFVLVAGLACSMAANLSRIAGEDRPPTSTAENDSQPPVAQRTSGGLDRFGDALPTDALARLGTVRLRHGWYTTALAYSPDGKLLATTGSERGLCLWDADSGKLSSVLIPSLQTYAVAFSPDSKSLVASGQYPQFHLFNVATGRQVQTFGGHEKGGTMCYAFSPNGAAIATGGHDNRVRVWDAATGRELRQLHGSDGSILSVAYSPDGSLIAGSGNSRTVFLWDAATGTPRKLNGHEGQAWRVAFSPDGKLLASGGSDKTVRIWDVAAAKQLHILNASSGDVEALAFAPDGRALASGDSDGRVRLWDPASGKELRKWRAHAIAVAALAFAPDGKTLTSTGKIFSTVRRWDPQTGREKGPIGGPQGQVQQLTFAADGRSLFVYSRDLVLRRWDWSRDAESTLVVAQPPSAASSSVLQYPAGGPLVASLNPTDHKIRVWEKDAGREPRILGAHPERVWSVAFSADGSQLLSGGDDRRICQWDARNGRLIHQTDALEDSVAALAFSPDGKTFASGVYRRSAGRPLREPGIRLWDAAAGKEIRTFDFRKDTANLLFSPDGSLLLAATVDLSTGVETQRLHLWEVATGKEQTLPETVQKGRALAFSPDGRLLAIGHGTPVGVTSIVEVASWQEVQRFAGHVDWPTAAAFSRDGTLLATGGYDANVLLFDRTGRHRPDAKPPAHPAEKTWDELASPDAALAYARVQDLAGDAGRAVPFLREHVRPVQPLDDAGRRQIRQVLLDLDSDRFSARQEAAKVLARFEFMAEPALREALKGKPTAEAQRQIESLLEELSAWSPNRLRISRAVAALEYIDTAESRRLLSDLSRGAPEAMLTREATVALRRLTAPALNRP
jgi:RNA polymerase sigma factor (sigma-70 family)